MKLRTSFFNPAVLKKDITRFAPLWGLYTVFMLLVLAVLQDQSPASFAREADSIMRAMGTVNLFYAGIAAVLLFGDLFKSRLAGALHAMPLRREGWFLTHLSAGLLFCLVPNALGAVIAAAMLGQYAYLAYIWLALMLLQYLCFFGIAVYSIQCSGSGIGAAAVYLIINYLSVLVLWLVKCFYEPVLFGITVNPDTLIGFSPALNFSQLNYVDINYTNNTDIAVFNGFVGKGWLYGAVAAATGLALTVAAVFMYRRRHLERAGDFISFRPAAPVFHVLYALCVGATLYAFANAINNGLETFFLVIGLALGWFTGKMLLEKRVKIFRTKTFIGFGVLVFVFFLSVSVVWLDPLGITRYVPEPEQVASVTVSPYTSDYYYNRESSLVTDPAQIEKLTQIHQDLVDARIENHSFSVLRLRYTLKNGNEVERTYYLDPNSKNGQWMKNIYSSPATVLGSSDLSSLKRSIRHAEVYQYNEKLVHQPEHLTWECKQEDWDALLEALMADCLAGNMTQLYDYRQGEEYVAVLNLQFARLYRDVLVYENCHNTIAFLQTHTPDPETQAQ